ncbi:hypothetical protein [Kluyvera genomosp. 1]|uniref:hypothetical protein n=1 Tax=Kluyvera genomosp. 1 TaxID=2774053 RepID=UPI000B0BB4AA|nr:hypothetical protein [Kluyvera genomosp. 1]
MKDVSYGGFLPIELSPRLNSIDFFIKRGIALNSARSALKLLVLSDKSISRIYIPAFACQSIIETIKSCGIDFITYHLDDDFQPINLELRQNDKLLYINYFGINDRCISVLAEKYPAKSLIIDNSQALFSEPIESIYATLYSPRKFIGIADGGYLSTEVELLALSYNSDDYDISHLLERRWGDREKAYKMFAVHEDDFSCQSISNISNASHDVLMACDLNYIKERRINNFRRLASTLNSCLDSDLTCSVPLTFPFICDKADNIKRHLVNKKIFTPTYWSECLNFSLNSFESFLINSLIHLPIDQRYNENDMSYISDVVSSL